MWDKSKMTLVGRYNKEIKIDTEYYYTSSRWESEYNKEIKIDIEYYYTNSRWESECQWSNTHCTSH